MNINVGVGTIGGEPWSAQRIHAECEALAGDMGPTAYVVATVATGQRRNYVCVSLYPTGTTRCGDDHKLVWAGTWDAAFSQAHEWVSARSVARDHGALV
jgi:hypothetical protein